MILSRRGDLPQTDRLYSSPSIDLKILVNYHLSILICMTRELNKNKTSARLGYQERIESRQVTDTMAVFDVCDTLFNNTGL